jgi:hypothetical protein
VKFRVGTFLVIAAELAEAAVKDQVAAAVLKLGMDAQSRRVREVLRELDQTEELGMCGLRVLWKEPDRILAWLAVEPIRSR